MQGLLLAGQWRAYAPCTPSAFESSGVIVQGLFLGTSSRFQETAAQAQNPLERAPEVVREEAIENGVGTAVGIAEDEGHMVDCGIEAGDKQIQKLHHIKGHPAQHKDGHYHQHEPRNLLL